MLSSSNLLRSHTQLNQRSYYEASVFAETAADLADGGYTLNYGDDGCRLGRAA